MSAPSAARSPRLLPTEVAAQDIARAPADAKAARPKAVKDAKPKGTKIKGKAKVSKDSKVSKASKGKVANGKGVAKSAAKASAAKPVATKAKAGVARKPAFEEEEDDEDSDSMGGEDESFEEDDDAEIAHLERMLGIKSNKARKKVEARAETKRTRRTVSGHKLGLSQHGPSKDVRDGTTRSTEVGSVGDSIVAITSSVCSGPTGSR